MASDYPIIEGQYLRDILDQPQALRDTLAGLDSIPALDRIAGELAQGVYTRIVETGMGGSFQVLHPLHLKLIEHGFTPVMAETSELIHGMPRLLDARTLLIAVSQSGRSAETVRLLDCGGPRPTTIGITNTPDSPLALRSEAVVLTRAGAEFSVSCKTVVVSLMALEWAGAILCRNDPRQTRSRLEQAAPAVEGYLARWKEHVQSICAEMRDVRHLFVTGRGASLAAAGIGGMIMKEAAHFHSEAMSSAAFRHGPFEMLNGDAYVVVLAGDHAVTSMNQGLVEDVRKAGARAALVSADAEVAAFRIPAVPPPVRPIVEMLPVQMISIALAALAGREAGRFERITKVTTVE